MKISIELPQAHEKALRDLHREATIGAAKQDAVFNLDHYALELFESALIDRVEARGWRLGDLRKFS